MGDPLFLNAPAIMRARKRRGVVSLEGVDCLRESGQPPGRLRAAVTAVVCVAVTCIWGFIFTSPDMPGINPTIDYAWYIPVGPLFNVVWLASTLGLICAFYLVLRAPPSNPARGVAVFAFLAQYLLRAAWAWAFFVQRTPYGSVILVEFFVLAAVISAIFAARVDRRTVLFMAPYISWITFVSFVTASKAFDAAEIGGIN
jgi:tryptophan-rich sensory protein